MPGIYLFPMLLYGMCIVAGSAYLFQVLKRGQRERRVPGSARRNAIGTGVLVFVFSLLISSKDIEGFCLASGFIFCYLWLSMLLADEFAPMRS